MLGILAQTLTEVDSYTTTLTADEKTGLAGLAIFGGVFLIFWLALLVVAVVSLWKVFEKAGVEGWKALIPGYNGWVLAEIAGKPGWWGIVGLGAIIPVVGFIASIAQFVLWILIAIELAKKFGKDTTFAILLVLVSVVGLAILGFGNAKYQGGKSTPSQTTGTTPPAQPTV